VIELLTTAHAVATLPVAAAVTDGKMVWEAPVAPAKGLALHVDALNAAAQATILKRILNVEMETRRRRRKKEEEKKYTSTKANRSFDGEGVREKARRNCTSSLQCAYKQTINKKTGTAQEEIYNIHHQGVMNLVVLAH
jgi:hypothetical protein